MPEQDLRARKSLGQHFLRDEAALRDIAARCDVADSAPIVEIGPGQGALTTHLRALDRPLVLVEKDRRFAALLRERYADDPLVTVEEGDATDFDFRGAVPTGRRGVAVGNLPYNVAAPIFFRLLDARQAYARLVLMFQREVADRLVAPPGSKTYGAPSVATALFTEARVVRRLSPGAFHPAPRVHSAVVQLDVLPAPRVPVAREDDFLKLVRALFRYRRKTVANALRQAGYTAPADLAARANVDLGKRPEALSPEDLVRLHAGIRTA